MKNCVADVVFLHNEPMYGLPSEFPCDQFVGQELTRIAFTATNCLLNLDDGQTEVNVLSSFHLLDPDGVRHDEDLPPKSGRIVALIGAKIVACAAQERGDLRLDFDNQWRLCLEDSAFPYVSYEINMVGHELTFLPPDLAMFLGRQIEAFSYTSSLSILPFGRVGDIRIEVEHAALSVRDEKGPLGGNAAELLRRITGQKVISGAQGQGTDFSLAFENGAILTVGLNSPARAGYRVFEAGLSVTV